MIPDPFAVVEPGFEPWQGPPDADLSQPDLTPCSLKEWLRSDEVTKALDRLQPARPAPHRTRVCLGYIPTFPR
jgi:hypothetical protein